MGTMGSFLGDKVNRNVKLTIHLNIVPVSPILVAITLRPQYAFIQWCLHRWKLSFELTHNLAVNVKVKLSLCFN